MCSFDFFRYTTENEKEKRKKGRPKKTRKTNRNEQNVCIWSILYGAECVCDMVEVTIYTAGVSFHYSLSELHHVTRPIGSQSEKKMRWRFEEEKKYVHM